jgi:thiol-disulfide isomerase/thioredoxin
LHRRTFIRWTTLGSLSALPLSLPAFVRAAELDLATYRGKVLYLDFWASWCGPCREAFPWLGEMAKHYGPERLAVIGVNVDKDRARAEHFLDATPANFPILYDPAGALATRFEVTGMPAAVLIDRQGRVRFQHVGFSAKKKDDYEDQIRTLVDEAAR